MKKIIFFTLFISSTLLIFAQDKGYKIKVTIKGMENQTLYLANYFGNKQYYADTAQANASGTAVFESKKPLKGGVYSIVLPGQKYFELILNEHFIDLATDTVNLVENMKIKKSVENKLFFDYLKFMNQKQKEVMPLRNQVKTATGEEKEKLEAQISKIDEAINNYRLDFIKNNPNTFVAKMFNTMREPEIPKDLTPEQQKDSTFQFRYYKNHFFDNVDFSDERLIRTPIYHNKIEKYFTKIILQHPDTINKEADKIVEKARANKELFKYTVHYLTNHFEKSKIMGMDAVFVHMALNYYNKENAFWADSTTLAKIKERAEKLEPLLIGKTAINLSLMDTTGQWVSLHNVNADYTILVFWDPECGHCKKELPKLAKYYQTIKDKNVKVYAVSSDYNEKWKKFIREHKLDFINVAVPKVVYEDQQKAAEFVIKGYTDLKSLNYSNTYDVYSTPQIYLLDKDKKIIGKKLDADLVKKILEHEWEIKNKK